MDNAQRKKPKQNHTGKVPTPSTFVMQAIGVVHSPFVERFATPHQPGAQEGVDRTVQQEGHIQLDDWLPVTVLDDLAGFERAWIVYAFHMNRGWKDKVVPPRGPKIPRGLFATRSPDRPNPIGLSLVKITGVESANRRVLIQNFDMLDGTPVLDIKPYLPYAEAFPNAKAGWVDSLPR